MKLFILKLLSLVVLCLGALSLAFFMGFAPVTDYVANLPQLLTQWQQDLPESFAWAKGLLEIRILWLIGSIVAFVFGGYGLFPRISKWKKSKKISYDGPHGLVQIELDTVEQSLNRVLVRMPEVKKIDVHVEPRDGGRSALIKADAVLQHQPGQNARAIAGLVSDYIAETATKMLGLEELATIELNVKAINVNTRKSSKEIRKESLSHSGNAPVELLEAAPKPMALSAPGQPLGSGPIEEEMEEEEGGDSAMEASAVDSAEEDSRQAAARSELLEPLSLHGAGDEEEEGDEHLAYSSEESPDSEDEVPDVVEKTVEGSAANASVVPEPLGDLSDDGDEDVTFEEEGGVEVPDEAQAAALYHVEAGAEEVPGALPEVEEASEEPSVEAADATEDEAEVADVAEEAPAVAEAEEVPAANSPWAPLESESTREEDVPLAEDADAPVSDETDSEIATDNGADGSTDSVFGEMDAEANGDEATSGPDDEATAVGEEDKEGEKKSWGWFN